MTALRLQKQALLLESDLNRLVLRAELRRLRAPLIWLRPGKGPGSPVSRRVAMAASVVGVALALGHRRTARLLGSALQAASAARGMSQTRRALAARAGTRNE